MNSQELVVPSHVTLQSVESWKFGRRLRLIVSTSPHFDPGVMGIAMAALNSFMNAGAQITLSLQKPPPENYEELERSIWCSPLGFFFFLFVDDADVLGQTVNLQSLKRMCWDYYQQNKGAIGRGNHVHWLSIDPAVPLPPILPTTKDNEFPKPSDFDELIDESIQKLSMPALTSVTEEPIVSFIYEAARNSFEHGRVSGPVEKVRGIRAISFERLIFASKTDLAHREFPEYHKAYLYALFDKPNFEKQILCVNILDQGPGIAGTLLPLPGENYLSNLIRAFVDGQSCKPMGVANRGLGLSKVLFASQQLGAFLQIYSGGLLACQDFLNADDKYPVLAPTLIRDLSSNLTGGTVLSLLIPQFSISPDQKKLF